MISALAVGALVVVLADRSQKDEPEAAPTAEVTGPQDSGAPPTAVTIVDRGTSVRIAWKDPTGGKYGFMVSMARAGQQLKPVAQVGPGKTQTEVIGLQPSLQYCFVVVAVYSTEEFGTSTQVCTERK
ncbi:fibronectin type III domain-containing protein [Actinoplanes utahensis]|uniref:fibronectin type III domain-containing protein n=1 Tax=Actinoplanes utahensis TaxID=1869 RepID=UPI00126A521A|nr:fibronectin type III domain-containing protein [Actinoplanes utahensis]